MWRAGLRGMGAREDIAAGEVLVSVPVAAALVVRPRERCPLPGEFCDAAFYQKAAWCAPPCCGVWPAGVGAPGSFMTRLACANLHL